MKLHWCIVFSYHFCLRAHFATCLPASLPSSLPASLFSCLPTALYEYACLSHSAPPLAWVLSPVCLSLFVCMYASPPVLHLHLFTSFSSLHCWPVCLPVIYFLFFPLLLFVFSISLIRLLRFTGAFLTQFHLMACFPVSLFHSPCTSAASSFLNMLSLFFSCTSFCPLVSCCAHFSVFYFFTLKFILFPSLLFYPLLQSVFFIFLSSSCWLHFFLLLQCFFSSTSPSSSLTFLLFPSV